MGEYFDPHSRSKHRCAVPSPSSFREHDGWRCDCGEAYVIERLSPRDVNPGELPYQWRRSPEHDLGRP